MKIDHIISRYYNEALCKYIVLARVQNGKEYLYRRIPYDTEEEARAAKEGDWIYTTPPPTYLNSVASQN